MASPDELRTRETSDEHLPGYAELYAELAPANPDPDTLGDVLQQRAAELGLPAAAGRGVPRALRPLVDILSRRHLVDDLGAYDTTVTWLELHVPHGGSGAIKWRTGGTGQAAFSLELLGSGLGSGRKTSWLVESDIPRRRTRRPFGGYGGPGHREGRARRGGGPAGGAGFHGAGAGHRVLPCRAGVSGRRSAPAGPRASRT
jgi:hypothetical protein